MLRELKKDFMNWYKYNRGKQKIKVAGQFVAVAYVFAVLWIFLRTVDVDLTWISGGFEFIFDTIAYVIGFMIGLGLYVGQTVGVMPIINGFLTVSCGLFLLYAALKQYNQNRYIEKKREILEDMDDHEFRKDVYLEVAGEGDSTSEDIDEKIDKELEEEL